MPSINAKLNLAAGLVAAGLIVCLFAEHRAWSGVSRANQDLRLQSSQMGALLTDNQRLLALLPAQSVQSSPSNQESNTAATLNEPVKELFRLRGEAEALRRETKAIEALRENTRQARLAVVTVTNSSGRPAQTQNAGTGPSGSQLEIVRAMYGSDKSRVDVTDELRDRIRGDSLKTIASNNLKGDPEYGQVKNLTIEYRFGGVTLTNHFSEGALIILPPPETTP